MNDRDDEGYEPPAFYEEEVLEEGGWEDAEPAERGFAQGRELDGQAAGPVLAMVGDPDGGGGPGGAVR